MICSYMDDVSSIKTEKTTSGISSCSFLSSFQGMFVSYQRFFWIVTFNSGFTLAQKKGIKKSRYEDTLSFPISEGCAAV